MIKLALVLILLLTISGCNNDDMKVQCIDGVKYLIRYSGASGIMSVKYNQDSTVSTCTKK